MGSSTENDKTKNVNINTYWEKCMSLSRGDIIREFAGNKYCSVSCRRENLAEIRKDMDDNYGEWVGRDI